MSPSDERLEPRLRESALIVLRRHGIGEDDLRLEESEPHQPPSCLILGHRVRVQVDDLGRLPRARGALEREAPGPSDRRVLHRRLRGSAARGPDVTPALIYGTAWKQERTAGLVEEALAAGFRAFDTANQKKHYREDYAGEAIKAAGLPRAQLFLQSKFTHVDGQDHRLPYDPSAPLSEQVRASFAGSLAHFGTDHLDSYLLHGPQSGGGMTDGDWEVWETLEELHRSGKARSIGVSNVGPVHLEELAGRARVKPMTVQNRCYAARGWDRAVRERCAADGIVYQGFSLLTANPHVVGDARVAAVARRLGVEPAPLVLRFAAAIGILPLTGTTDGRHMRQDLAAMSMELSAADVAAIASL